jgi:hypothetical protein
MTTRDSGSARLAAYSPERRTALVLCGTGAHGAYHAGALRAFQEAGVRIDLLAGHGVGAASAALAAIDGGSRLWEANGIWRSPQAGRLYRWRRITHAVAAAVRRPVRRAHGRWWWRLIGAPVDVELARAVFVTAIWALIRGAAPAEPPAPAAVGRRYADVLLENLGQPGFRELVLVATDLDARRDVVAALLRDPFRAEWLASRGDRSEILDLAGVARDHASDMVNAALTPAVVCEPALVTFASDSFWRGETHRFCDRPCSLTRLLDEVAAAGVTQVIVVSAVATAPAPHQLRVPRLDLRSRLGDFAAAAEAAALRDAIQVARLRFDAVYVVRPSHNAIGPFDTRGAYDEASDRRPGLPELMERAYDDAYRQFIEPVVGASGEQLAVGS